VLHNVVAAISIVETNVVSEGRVRGSADPPP